MTSTLEKSAKKILAERPEAENSVSYASEYRLFKTYFKNELFTLKLIKIKK